MRTWGTAMFSDDLASDIKLEFRNKIGFGKSPVVATEFDHKMFGYESKPLNIIVELINELKNIGKELSFKKFNGITDLENQVKLIIE